MTGKKQYQGIITPTPYDPDATLTWDKEFRIHVMYRHDTSKTEWISVYAPSRVAAKKKVNITDWKILAIQEK